MELLTARLTNLERLQKNLPETEKSVQTAEQKVADAQKALADANKDLATAEITQAAFHVEASVTETVAEENEEETEDSDTEAAATGGGAAGYDAASGIWLGKRPSKPKGKLKGEDEDKVSLTAHHILPWNQIRDSLNAALSGGPGKVGDPTKLRALLKFAEVDVAPGFWKQLDLPPADRPYAFSQEVNRIAQDICWSPKNIFMGPLNTLRGDDPGEELDTAFSKGGLPTMASAAGVLTSQTGGIGAHPAEFNEAKKKSIEAKYLKKGKVKDISALSDEEKEKMEQELINAGVWEAVRGNFPKEAAAARKQKAMDGKMQELYAEALENEGLKDGDELPKDALKTVLMLLKQFEDELPEGPTSESDLTKDEKEELEKLMQNLGAGFDSAKAEYLKKVGKASESDLDAKERGELDAVLAKAKGPQQRLAEMVTARARQAEGADLEKDADGNDVPPANAARGYDQDDWELDASGKKVRRGASKVPSAIAHAMDRVDRAIDAKVVSKNPPLRPSKLLPKEQPIPDNPLIKSDFDSVLGELTAARLAYEIAYKALEKQPRPSENEPSGQELLQRFPVSSRALAMIDARIAALKKQQADAPDAL